MNKTPNPYNADILYDQFLSYMRIANFSCTITFTIKPVYVCTVSDI